MLRIHILIFTLMAFLGTALHAATGGGDVYRSIMQKNTVRIGVSRDYPPLVFNAGEKGAEIEMVRRFGDFPGVRVELVRASEEGGIELKRYVWASRLAISSFKIRPMRFSMRSSAWV